jgi:hypothetical protein
MPLARATPMISVPSVIFVGQLAAPPLVHDQPVAQV